MGLFEIRTRVGALQNGTVSFSDEVPLLVDRGATTLELASLAVDPVGRRLVSVTAIQA